MQEIQFPGAAAELAREMRFYRGNTEGDVVAKMDARLREAEALGGVLVRRVKVGRNDTCPCGSGVKFKKCCIDKAA